MSKLAHSNQETMDEIERRSEIEGDYIASIEGPHEDKPPAHPSLEELDKCIAINEAFKARKNADVIINPDRATDIELYCLRAVRDGAHQGQIKPSRMKSTQAMRDRCRELSFPNRDDYDRAVLCILDDLEDALNTKSSWQP